MKECCQPQLGLNPRPGHPPEPPRPSILKLKCPRVNMVIGPPRNMSTCIVAYHHIQILKCSRVNMVLGPPRDISTCIVTHTIISKVRFTRFTTYTTKLPEATDRLPV